MESKGVKLFVFIISIAGLSWFGFLLFRDAVFFATKKHSKGIVTNVNNLGDQRPYAINLRYYNEYTRSSINVTTTLKKHYGKKLIENANPVVSVDYGKWFPEYVYLAEYVTPTIGVLFFDLFLVAVMLLSLYLFKNLPMEILKRKKL